MACRYTTMLMAARYTAPVSLMLLRRCRIQCHNVSTASLTTVDALEPPPTQCRQDGADVVLVHYPAARCLLLVHSFVLSTSFVTWVYNCIYRRRSWCGHSRSANYVMLLRCISPAFVTFVDTSPTTASVPWWCRLFAQDSATATSS